MEVDTEHDIPACGPSPADAKVCSEASQPAVSSANALTEAELSDRLPVVTHDVLDHFGTAFSECNAYDEAFSETDTDDEDNEDNEEDLPEARWDAKDSVYRCTRDDCGWDVNDEAMCNECCANYRIEEMRLTDYELDLYSEGITILPFVEQFPADPSEIGLSEDALLLKRGVSQDMLDAHSLRFDINEGIFCQLDGYEDELCPALEDGQIFELHLGFRIHLHPLDPDGSSYLGHLLNYIIDTKLAMEGLNDHTQAQWITEKRASSDGWILRYRTSQEISSIGSDNLWWKTTEADSLVDSDHNSESGKSENDHTMECDKEVEGSQTTLCEIDMEDSKVLGPKSSDYKTVNQFPAEVLSLIFSNIKCSECLKSIRSVCKSFRKVVGEPDTLYSLVKSIELYDPNDLAKLNWQRIASHACGPRLFEEYDDVKRRRFDPLLLAANEFISLDFVKKYRDFFNWPQCWKEISRNSAISEKDVRDNLDLPWSWSELAENDSLSIEFYLDFQTKPIAWRSIEHLDVLDYLKLAKHDIDWLHVWNECDGDPHFCALLLAQKPSIIREPISFMWSCKPLDIFAIASAEPDESDVWGRLSGCYDITIEHVKARPDAEWNFARLAKVISLRQKLENTHFPWPSIAVQTDDEVPSLPFVLATPDLPWDYESLIHYWPMEVFVHADKPYPSFFRWPCITSRATFDLVFQLKYEPQHEDLPWCWAVLSQKVDEETLLKHPDAPWRFDQLEKRKWSANVYERFDGHWDPYLVLVHLDLNTVTDDQRSKIFKGSNLSALSVNSTLTADMVKANASLPWDYSKLGRLADDLHLSDSALSDRHFDWFAYAMQVTRAGFLRVMEKADLMFPSFLTNANLDVNTILQALELNPDIDLSEHQQTALSIRAIDERLDLNFIQTKLSFDWNLRILTNWNGSSLCCCHRRIDSSGRIWYHIGTCSQS